MALAPVKNRAKSNNTPKQKALRGIRNLSITVVALGLFAATLGLGYVWIMGRQEKVIDSTASQKVASAPSAMTPKKLPDNIPIGSSIQTITSPVAPGANASMTIRTTESAVCSIQVIHTDSSMRITGQVTDSGLGNKTADEFGMVVWTWTMPSNATKGTWKATVLCQRGDKSTQSIGQIVVQ